MPITPPPASDGPPSPSESGTGVAVSEPAGGPPDDGGVPPVAEGRRGYRWLLEAVVIVVVALGVALLLRTFVVQTFFIPSGSMLPTLQIGDRIVVNKLSYDLHGVGRGDIIVFQRPPNEQCGGPPVNDLVKRVIGLPGDTISLYHGHVYIDHRELAEPYLAPYEQGVTSPGPSTVFPFSLIHPYVVPAGEYYVMGDNRTASCDSRYWGPVPASLIVGKVELRIWPLSHLHIF